VQPPKRAGVKRKHTLRTNDPCGAFVNVGRSTARGSDGHYHIRSMHLGHSNCTGSATPKMARIVEDSNFRSLVAGQRGANVNALGDNLKKVHVAASKQLTWRCTLNPG